MFKIGDYTVCGHNGVCRVEDITTLNISGVDKSRKYYILKPVYLSASVVYVPLDTEDNSMRRVLSEEDAKELMESVGETDYIETRDERMLEKTYKEWIKRNRCSEWLRLLKTIYHRRQERLHAGRKVTAVDEKYFRLVSENLYGELSIALGEAKEDVEHYLMARLGETVVG